MNNKYLVFFYRLFKPYISTTIKNNCAINGFLTKLKFANAINLI